MKRAIATLLIVGCTLVLALPVGRSNAASTSDTATADASEAASPVSTQVEIVPSVLPVAPVSNMSSTDDPGDTCQVILARAMDTLQSNCQSVGRNKACYGNNLVQAEPKADTSLQFDTVGDVINIADVLKLNTAPLDVTNGIWGLSLLKLQANLPDTLPGQNVTFLVFGDTRIDNASGDMRSFYFSSGLGVPTCKEAPQDSIVVKSPNHMQVTFTANGAQITIASTVVLRAEAGKQMTVALVEGHANVTTSQGSQDLMPGEELSVPLGGKNGLTASGPPSDPQHFDDITNPAVDSMIETTQDISDPDDAQDVTVNGCITSIKGNMVMVGGYRINVGSDATLKAASVGDCLDISGTTKGGNGRKGEFVLIKATPQKSDPLLEKTKAKIARTQKPPSGKATKPAKDGNNGNSGGGNNGGNGGGGNSGGGKGGK